MTHGSLFSGIGGFDLAAEWMGWQNVFHCEWNAFGQKVLKHYWPKAISYNDITQTDFTIHKGRIDILTGGFPCQPYSLAGKRKGKEDERHLWPHMLRAIREISPCWVVGENVFGLVNWSGGLVFHEVQTDLEAQGYEVQPFILPAVAVNAPHRRDRVWFVSYSKSARAWKNIGGLRCLSERCDTGAKDAIPITDTSGERWDNGCNNRGERQISSDEKRNTTKSQSERCGRVGRTGEVCSIGDASDTDGQRHEKCQSPTFTSQQERQHRKTNFANRPGDWENFPSQSPVCHGNDGFPAGLDGITFSKWRQESIKAGGNAIVPQVALQIFKTIEEYEKLNT